MATVHHCRSLSVGSLAPVKDRLKALCNFKPDLRILRNEVMARTIGFKDDVPQPYVGMDVPPTLVERARRLAPEPPDLDFVYIGAVSKDRRLDAMIESFLRRYPSGRRLLLIGPAERSIIRAFMGQETFILTGRLSQSESFDLVMRSRVAVSYFPSHRPHCYQTPTKQIEYAALGRPILANDSPMNLATIRRYEIGATATSGDVFATAPEPEEIVTGPIPDPCPFTWPSVIAESGIEERLKALIAARAPRS